MFQNASNIVITGGNFTTIVQAEDASEKSLSLQIHVALISCTRLSGAKAQKFYTKLCRWLRPLNFHDWAFEYSSTRIKGSCEWSTHHPMIQDWLHPDSLELSRLWIHGGPGTGKSFLAAYLMDRKRTQRLPEEVVFTAFCKTQGDVRPSSASILLGFIRQYLVDYYPNVDLGIVKEIGDTIFAEKKGYQFNAKQVIPHLWSILDMPEFTRAW